MFLHAVEFDYEGTSSLFSPVIKDLLLSFVSLGVRFVCDDYPQMKTVVVDELFSGTGTNTYSLDQSLNKGGGSSGIQARASGDLGPGDTFRVEGKIYRVYGENRAVEVD